MTYFWFDNHGIDVFLLDTIKANEGRFDLGMKKIAK